MRLRFSLRLVFAAMSLLAVALYLLAVRPTALAQRFIDAVQAGDFKQAESLVGDGTQDYFTGYWQESQGYDVEVELARRRWSDLFKFQRRISVKIIPQKPREQTTVVVAVHAEALANCFGIQPPSMYPVIYRH